MELFHNNLWYWFSYYRYISSGLIYFHFLLLLPLFFCHPKRNHVWHLGFTPIMGLPVDFSISALVSFVHDQTIFVITSSDWWSRQEIAVQLLLFMSLLHPWWMKGQLLFLSQFFLQGISLLLHQSREGFDPESHLSISLTIEFLQQLNLCLSAAVRPV